MKMPRSVVLGRQSVCRTCPTPCNPSERPDPTAPESRCPLPAPRWRSWEEIRPRRGLGDAVAVVAQPIARAVDAVLGTDLENCGGCRRRRAALNALGKRDMR